MLAGVQVKAIDFAGLGRSSSIEEVYAQVFSKGREPFIELQRILMSAGK